MGGGNAMPVNSFENYPMSWKPDLSNTKPPIYLALVRQLEDDIKAGALKPGTKLPPQRELADYLDINLSTVSRAFKICEQKGLLSASVGNGTYISSDVTSDKVFICGQENPPFIEMGALYAHVEATRKVKQYAERLLKKPDALKLFSYTEPEGTEIQRAAGAAWFHKMGLHTDSQHIILAAGGQNALAATVLGILDQGERIGTDYVTYPGIKTIAQMIGVQLVAIQHKDFEMTKEGIYYAIQNENIKAIYVIPDFHNPTSHIMSLETRKMIAQIAQEKNILIIEDAINNLLEDNPLPPIASFAPEQVICLASLSKTIAPGLRTAFIYVPEKYHCELATALYSMNISNPSLLSTISADLIINGIADEIIMERKKEISNRNLIVNDILNGYLLESKLTCPIRYLLLPDYFTGKSFEICALQAGVQVFGAERFTVGNKPAEKTARISVITPSTINDLTEGAQRLKKILS